MYLLDTNILSELVRRIPNPRVEFRFDSEPQALFTSVICLEEIRFGAKIGPPGNKLWERMESDFSISTTSAGSGSRIGSSEGLATRWLGFAGRVAAKMGFGTGTPPRSSSFGRATGSSFSAAGPCSFFLSGFGGSRGNTMVSMFKNYADPR